MLFLPVFFMHNCLQSVVRTPELVFRFHCGFLNLDKKNRIAFSGSASLLAVHCENAKSWFFADLLSNFCYSLPGYRNQQPILHYQAKNNRCSLKVHSFNISQILRSSKTYFRQSEFLCHNPRKYLRKMLFITIWL